MTVEESQTVVDPGFPPLPDDTPWRTMCELVAASAVHGDRTWQVARSATGRIVSLTYSEMPDVVATAASMLADHGVGPGTVVGVHLDNTAGLEASVLHLAVHWRGAVAVPMNTRFRAPEITAIASDAEVSLVLSADPSRVPGSLRVLDCRPGLMALLGSYRGIEPAPVGEHDVADVLYTSGTSGRPKGAEMTHANCVSCGCELVHAMGLGENDVLQSAAPYYTSTGAHTIPFAALCAGAGYVMEPEFDQHRFVERIAEHGTTVYFGVPSMYALLLRDADLGAIPDSLHTVVSGGSLLSRAKVAEMRAAFPGRGIVNLYGQTEAGPGGTVLGPDDTELKPGSVGRRGNGPHTSFRVVRPDGTPCAVDETGEIQLRSPAVMRGYRGKPTETARTLVDGWLNTGDIGRMDADGYLYFVDRRQDVVVRGGMNISTVEVEHAFAEHPNVADVAVVGVPHDVLGEDLRAFVVVTAPTDVGELRAFVHARVADYKTPRRVTVVDQLPRNTMGKVLKRELRNREEA